MAFQAIDREAIEILSLLFKYGVTESEFIEAFGQEKLDAYKQGTAVFHALQRLNQ